MDAVLRSVKPGRDDVDELGQGADHDGQPQDGFPVLTYVPRRLPAPADGQQEGDDGDHAHKADGEPPARHRIGDALALFDAVEHLGLEKTSQFRG